MTQSFRAIFNDDEEHSKQIDLGMDQALQNLKMNISSELDTSIERTGEVENTWDVVILDEDEWE